jgi:hypothetical protein
MPLASGNLQGRRGDLGQGENARRRRPAARYYRQRVAKEGRDVWALSGGALWNALTSLGDSLQAPRLPKHEASQPAPDDGVRATGVMPHFHGVFGLWKIDGYAATARAIRDNFDVFPGSPAGFEVRTSRRCQRILMFHHFEELGPAPKLVRSLSLDYDDFAYGQGFEPRDELEHPGSTRIGSFMRRATLTGYADNTRDMISMPGPVLANVVPLG